MTPQPLSWPRESPPLPPTPHRKHTTQVHTHTHAHAHTHTHTHTHAPQRAPQQPTTKSTGTNAPKRPRQTPKPGQVTQPQVRHAKHIQHGHSTRRLSDRQRKSDEREHANGSEQACEKEDKQERQSGQEKQYERQGEHPPPPLPSLIPGYPFPATNPPFRFPFSFLVYGNRPNVLPPSRFGGRLFSRLRLWKHTNVYRSELVEVFAICLEHFLLFLRYTIEPATRPSTHSTLSQQSIRKLSPVLTHLPAAQHHLHALTVSHHYSTTLPTYLLRPELARSVKHPLQTPTVLGSSYHKEHCCARLSSAD
jgi:hypothetical protein